jgi:adenosine kinase
MPKNKKTIFISGSLVYDRIMDFPGYFKDHIMPDKIHILNVSFAVNNMRESFGGTAGNIAYNLSLLGERPSIIATAGNDFTPYKKWLDKNKIDSSLVKIIKNKNTASCYITTDMSDNQITAFNPGALTVETRHCLISTDFKKFGKGNTEKIPPAPFVKGGVGLAIIAPGNIKDMENYARFYKKANIKYIFDPGQQITALSSVSLKSGIKGAEILIGNDYEISLINKKTGWTTKDLIDKVNMLVVTMGDKGSLIYYNKKKHIIKPAKVKKAVDPTGAGDAYRAGLIKGIIKGYNIKKCGQLASVVASFAVEKHGTQEHRFSKQDVENRYRANYKEKLLY